MIKMHFLLIFLVTFINFSTGYDDVNSNSYSYNYGSGSLGSKSYSKSYSYSYSSSGSGGYESAAATDGSGSNSQAGIKTNSLFLKSTLRIPPMDTCLQSYKVPLNSHFTCESSKCNVKCYENYEFPDKRTELTLMCIFGKWVITETAKWKIMPDCEAICSPPCQNGGTCLSPGFCKCSDKFVGKYCEEAQPVCKTRPVITNALTSCVGTSTSGYKKCIVQCNRNYYLEGKVDKVDIKCLDGTSWTRSDDVNRKVFAENQCSPTCDPPCQNGGTCISYNLCQCPIKYGGPGCQYEKSVCNITTVGGFNGGYNCKSDSDYYNCTINCPTGISFTSTPASLYSCRFAEGKFYPSPVPKCIYPAGYSVSSSKYYKHDISNKEISRSQSSGYYDLGEAENYLISGGSSGTINFGKYQGGIVAGAGGGGAGSDYYSSEGKYNKYSTSYKDGGSVSLSGGGGGGGSGMGAYGSAASSGGIGSGTGSSSSFSILSTTKDFTKGMIEGKDYGQVGIGIGGYGGSLSFGGGAAGIGGYGSGGYSSGGYGSGSSSSLTQSSLSLIEREKMGYGYYLYSTPGIYSFSLTSSLSVSKTTPQTGLCVSWNGVNLRTFDGLTLQSQFLCSHTMIVDRIDGSFKVVLRTCQAGNYNCPYALIIYWNDFEGVIENKNDQIILSTPKNKIIPIPVKIVGIDITFEGRYLKIDLETIGLKILWDKQQFVSFEAHKKLFNRTEGLCGTFDGDVRNDMAGSNGVTYKTPRSFIDAWSVYYPEETNCESSKEINYDLRTYDILIKSKGEQVLYQLFGNYKLDACWKVLNKSAAIEFGLRDYYNCPNTKDRNVCICDTLAMIVAQCTLQGVEVKEGWRDLSVCPIKCTSGRVYNQCGPTVERTCGSTGTDIKGKCIEGCFCPEGTVLHNNICIRENECPCSQGGKDFKNGAEIKKDCNTCTCKNGYWKCTEYICGARCVSYGSSHFITFDGQEYDFRGKCSYIMLKSGKLIIEVEKDTVLTSKFKKMPSTKSLTISHIYDGKEIKLKLDKGKTVYKDGRVVNSLPLIIGDSEIIIRYASSYFITVEFANGIRILWDGDSRAYIDAPASIRDKTGGLCGAFNSNTKLDFITPEGDYETAVKPFVDKWRTKDSCPPISESKMELHPCSENPQLKEKAAKYCAHLTGKLFEDCHWAVCPNQFYENCMFDVCACTEEKLSECYCPIISAYNDECSRHGVKIDSRRKVPECGAKCPIGQIYEENGLICARSCKDLATNKLCNNETYIEGCRCPSGQLLNDQSECIPQNACPCSYDGLNFESGYKEVRPGKYGMELCLCNQGSWICKSSKPQDITLYPPYRGNCKDKLYMEFSKCAPVEPKTCHNMHNYNENLEDCKSDCVCIKGYVYDRSKKQCVLPEECSCHHSGRSYEDGQTIDEECSKCKCVAGKWKCEPKPCEAVCSVWGDSHFNTFDGLGFDFQGVCDYYLSKGIDSNGNGFTISIQNVLCGSLGVTCSKSLKISLSGYTTETITLSSDISIPKPIYKPNDKNSLIMYKSGIFQVVEDSYIGVQVKWDFGTRVYVKLNNKWKGKVKGLCGDYNGDAVNDMVTPSGAKETRSTFFGHSWVSRDSCLLPTEPINACKEHPQRESWAQHKCGIIKSDVFKQCHGEVSYEKYLKKCIFDSCACDQGGDCECLCTAIASYAYACSQHGINIKWRTPTFCPMQCDGTCSSYSACVSPCPLETCDNLLDQGISNLMCKQEKCSEGCQIKQCQDGYIYSNDTYLECVPKAKCAPVCIEKDGKKYYEGDIVPSSECQTCRCTKNKVVCSGEPCVETKESCINGWTKWINEDEFVLETISKKVHKPERVPSTAHPAIYGACEKEMMTKIECKTVDTYKTPLEAGDSCTCDLKDGFKCKGTVKNDYEIRVLCDCTKEPIVKKPEGCEVAIKEYKEYIGDCHKFYHCIPQTDGKYGYAEKTCGPSMMFNPTNNICDHIVSVVKIKPECGVLTTTSAPKTTQKPYIITSTVKPAHYEQIISTIKPHIIVNTTKPPSYVTSYVPKTTKPPALPAKSISDCDPNIKQYDEYKGDCSKFLQCAIQGDGSWKYVEKVCGPGMYYNPTNYICDFMSAVLKIKPECSEPVKTTKSYPITFTTVTPARYEQLITSKPKPGVVVIQTTKPPIHYVVTPKLPIGDCNINIKEYDEYLGDCQKFLHCSIQTDGSWKYVEKVCGPGTYYHPIHKICDFIANVIKIKPECGDEPIERPIESLEYQEIVPVFPTYQKVDIIETNVVEKCPIGKKWVSCSNRCKKSCHYYGRTLVSEGKCRPNERCRPGCVENNIPDCAAEGKFWRDAYKCVDAEDCPCLNLDGTLVKPHQTYTESTDDSKLCQCLANQYVCKEVYESENITETKPLITGQESLNFDIKLPRRVRIVVAVKRNITCATKRFAPIINAPKPLPDTIFSASSSKSDKHFPNYARFDSKYAWSPMKNDNEEYLEIKLPYPEKIFGILMQGSPNDEEFVSLYQVLYSMDGEVYHSINDKTGKQQIFSGPIDADNPVKTVLKIPIEAKVIRIYPIKWHGAIAMQIELFGCDEAEPITITTTKKPYHITDPPLLPIIEKTTKKPYIITEPPKYVPVFVDKITTTKKPYYPTEPPYVPVFVDKITTTRKPYHPTEPPYIPAVVEKVTTTKKPYQPTEPPYIPIIVDKVTTKKSYVVTQPTTYVPVIIEKVTTTKKPYTVVEHPDVPPIGIQRTTKPPVITTHPPYIPLQVTKATTTKKPYIVTDAPIVPICEESMGVYNDLMKPEQVKASSRYSAGVKTHVPKVITVLKLNSALSWRPAINSEMEYIQFDFLEPRKLTGLKTLGGPNGYVTAFNVMYSNDARTWNNVLDLNGGKLFVGNQGSDILKVNFFDHPVKARYLKVYPAKWQDNINIKMEPLGCFEPYPIIPKVPEVPLKPITTCSICDGVDDLIVNDAEARLCKCNYPKFWDGKRCVAKDECPCVDNHVTYSLGAKFETRDCEECICVLGGVKQCYPKKCPPCAKGLRHVKSQQCLCLCEKCPPGTRICQTSGDCIKESEWCDGIKNCEDDENEECKEQIIQTIKPPKPTGRSILEKDICIIGQKSYKVGEKWSSPDNCTTYECKLINNKYEINSYSITCPPVDCEPSLVYKDSCCPKCKPKPESKQNCAAEPLNELDSVKLIAVYDAKHALCINKQPIIGFTQCIGHCPSGTKYSKISAKHEAYCDCCKVQSYKKIIVPLTCEDGFTLKKEIEVPEICSCNACEGTVKSPISLMRK